LKRQKIPSVKAKNHPLKDQQLSRRN